jgi:hypothetical protein
MPSILEQISKPTQPFRPTSVTDFMLLQMLRPLIEPSALPKYIAAAQHRSIPALLRAYRTAFANSGSVSAFLAELTKINHNSKL